MRFRGKMYDGVDLMMFEQRAHRGLVADIPLHENIPRIPVQAREVVDIAGIGECIEHHHPPLTGVCQPVPHEIGSDEAGSSCYQNVPRFKAHSTSTSNCAANAAQERSPRPEWIWYRER